MFCDASAKAYACAIFLRVERRVSICLLASKTRVAPLKEITILRLELLGATIAARLYISAQSNFDVCVATSGRILRQFFHGYDGKTSGLLLLETELTRSVN